MAVYGPNNTGFIPFTGYSNTLGTGAANVGATTGAAQFNGLSQGDDRIAKMIRNGGMGKNFKAIWFALTGNAVGASATANRAQVQWQQGSPGGLIPIEVLTVTNRVTTAADQIAFDALLNRNTGPTTYPPDLSGNGGGGKVTY